MSVIPNLGEESEGGCHKAAVSKELLKAELWLRFGSG